ncbi:glycine-rich protein [Striga asiatica]|uniref:Glycine-rich protein n=1 Tax=Striga asiatica TaxID=4170 RepID=A0A5A7PVJ1_STRAF|nr:glycine-rich protein [Striga asiatica]
MIRRTGIAGDVNSVGVRIRMARSGGRRSAGRSGWGGSGCRGGCGDGGWWRRSDAGRCCGEGEGKLQRGFNPLADGLCNLTGPRLTYTTSLCYCHPSDSA